MHRSLPRATLIEAPPAPRIAEPVDPDLLSELLHQVDERGQVTVHGHFTAQPFDGIRIWPSTFLICRHTGHRSALVHAEGIPYAPTWLPVTANRTVQFTLVFAPLPRSCSVFDLVEEIPDEGGFHVSGIVRNPQDLYRVEV